MRVYLMGVFFGRRRHVSESRCGAWCFGVILALLLHTQSVYCSDMNEEKALLIEKCLTNPVLRIVARSIAIQGNQGAWVRVSIDGREGLASTTALSLGRLRKAIAWLERKSLFLSKDQKPFPQRGGRYVLDSELWEAVREVKVRRFGDMAKRILEPFETDRNRDTQLAILSFGNQGRVSDEYGVPLPLDEARQLRDALARYVDQMDKWGDISLEKHRQSRRRLIEWGGRHGSPFYGKPPALVCDCVDCKTDYEEVLTAWTNSTSYSKQENKIIRDAIKEL
jgi:hypothetical protein